MSCAVYVRAGLRVYGVSLFVLGGDVDAAQMAWNDGRPDAGEIRVSGGRITRGSRFRAAIPLILALRSSLYLHIFSLSPVCVTTYTHFHLSSRIFFLFHHHFLGVFCITTEFTPV